MTVLGLRLPPGSDMGFAPGRGGRVSAQPWAQRKGGGVSLRVPVVTLQRKRWNLLWFPQEIWEQSPCIPFPVDELVEIVRQFSLCL